MQPIDQGQARPPGSDRNNGELGSGNSHWTFHAGRVGTAADKANWCHTLSCSKFMRGVYIHVLGYSYSLVCGRGEKERP